ncbi:MAG: sulfite exporter TauE/SafE family protein [Nitrospiraceae bacterium]|nr:MAG: sulfite exporter TauE/SafE family protein [Nitrospiraceae bacterium]
MEAGYLAAFTTGLIGGFGHCTGMCGPIVVSYTLQGTSSFLDRILSGILYNTGRITTYMFTGALMGLAGSFVNVAGKMAGFQNIVAIIAGLFMMFMGLGISGLTGNAAWTESRAGLISKAGMYIMMEKSRWRYFPLGALFGFIPCGLSYSIFIASAGTGDLLSGMLVSLLFGLGTLPSLLLVGAVAAYIRPALRGLLYKAAGWIIIATGTIFLVRGIRHYAQM